jgi:outer membrane protein OmpA-like peptidoglycan-associated protein
LRSDLIADLHILSNNLRSYPDTGIQVIGHTDNTGAASYNNILSAGFAESISRVLLNNGVDPSRIMTVGRGEDQPTASNLTAQGRAQNRRVEIVIRPKAVNG